VRHAEPPARENTLREKKGEKCQYGKAASAGSQKNLTSFRDGKRGKKTTARFTSRCLSRRRTVKGALEKKKKRRVSRESLSGFIRPPIGRSWLSGNMDEWSEGQHQTAEKRGEDDVETETRPGVDGASYHSLIQTNGTTTFGCAAKHAMQGARMG